MAFYGLIIPLILLELCYFRTLGQNQPADPMEAAVEQDVQSDTVNENRPRRTKEEDDKSLVYNFTCKCFFVIPILLYFLGSTYIPCGAAVRF